MGSEVANRPSRIGTAGVTMQWSFREVDGVTLAAREQARVDGTTLSEVMRTAGRAYLERAGWNVDSLISGDPDVVDAEWRARMNRKAPRTRSPRKRRLRIVDPIDGTDPETGTAPLF